MDILGYAVVGFLAQIVDGALGMAYGVLSTTVLLTLGLAPVEASAAVHAAEVFTTGASGAAHLYHRNVERSLFWRLVLPGVVGGAAGAFLLTELPGEPVRSLVAAYLAVMGLVILARAVTGPPRAREVRRVGLLGFVGGLLDAVGGGGWGPIVASTLIARGSAPRYVIGSVILAEFFVTFAASATFVAGIGLGYFRVVLGLLLGGIVAAPLAATVVKRLPARTVMVLVGLLVVGLSAHTIYRALL